MKKFQKINHQRFNQIPTDQLSNITGGNTEFTLCNVRETILPDGTILIQA